MSKVRCLKHVFFFPRNLQVDLIKLSYYYHDFVGLYILEIFRQKLLGAVFFWFMCHLAKDYQTSVAITQTYDCILNIECFHGNDEYVLVEHL